MHDEIRVYVISKPGRRNLYLLAKRGTQFVAEKSARTTRTRDAERTAAVWQREFNDEANPRKARPMAWDEFTERYIGSREGKRADGTLLNGEITLDAFARIVGSMQPREVTTDHVDQFIAGLVDVGARDATVDRHLRHLRAAMRWAHKRRIVRELPQFEMRGGESVKGRPLTLEEFDRMLDSVPAGLVGITADDEGKML